MAKILLIDGSDRQIYEVITDDSGWASSSRALSDLVCMDPQCTYILYSVYRSIAYRGLTARSENRQRRGLTQRRYE